MPASRDRRRSLPVKTGPQARRAVCRFLTTFFALWLLALRSAHAGDPDLRWRTIETEHFRISYHEPLGQVAQRLVQVAETSHRVLVPVMGHAPRFRTEVVLTDDTDFSNGSAKNLRELVDFYDRRFDMKLTEQEKVDLINFLSVL